jgi:hypothetical protein
MKVLMNGDIAIVDDQDEKLIEPAVRDVRTYTHGKRTSEGCTDVHT